MTTQEPTQEPTLVAELRALLRADREHTVARIRDLGDDVSAIVDAASLTATDDEHDPEGATIAFERSQAGALLASARQHLQEVDQALARLDDATFGRCEGCGRPIAPARLHARPTARTCIDCARTGR